MLTLILGGARSGKSRLAQRLAASAPRVCYVATAVAGEDPEMRERIERHRSVRPSHWQTFEEPVALADAIDRAAKCAYVILVDCLTLWLSNVFWEHRDNAPAFRDAGIQSEVRGIAAAGRSCHIILVSNEVGSGTVPDAQLTREFRDAQGLLNQSFADAADEVILTVAGLPLYLKQAAR